MAEEAKSVYFDQQFIDGLNEIDNSRYTQILQIVTENLTYEASHETLSSIHKLFNSIFAAEKNPIIIYRKLKSLVHSCVYNRFSKKFKNDVASLGLRNDKIDILCDLVKIDIDSLNERLKTSDLTSHLKDFEIKTEMPVSYTNYPSYSQQQLDNQNIDYKKQQLNFSLTLDEGGVKSVYFTMDKGQLVNFYEEIEKIQEKLDKLY